jgi:hypothetical protein
MCRVALVFWKWRALPLLKNKKANSAEGPILALGHGSFSPESRRDLHGPSTMFGARNKSAARSKSKMEKKKAIRQL